MTTRDPNAEPDRLYCDVRENRYRHELQLLDRYQAFAAEIVRLSLLGIGAFGYIYEKVLEDNEAVSTQFTASFILFGAAAAFALGYRYLSTDALRYYVFGLRAYELTKEQESATEQFADVTKSLRRRNCRLAVCPWLKGLAVICLIGAAVVLAWAFVVVVRGSTVAGALGL